MLRMGVTVLIVDDHPVFRSFARRLLEQAGFAVVGEAEDCASGIEAAHALRPQAVLLDIVLPDGSGLAVAADRAASYETTAVVLTSTRSADDIGAALAEAPARGFIPKDDFTGEAFAALVEER